MENGDGGVGILVYGEAGGKVSEGGDGGGVGEVGGEVGGGVGEV